MLLKAKRWALPAKDASDPCRMISRMVDEAVKSKRMKAPGRPSPPLPPWSRCGEYSSTICWPLATTSKPRVQHCGPTLGCHRFRTTSAEATRCGLTCSWKRSCSLYSVPNVSPFIVTTTGVGEALQRMLCSTDSSASSSALSPKSIASPHAGMMFSAVMVSA